MEPLDVFSPAWCQAWAEKVRASKEFAVFNKGWEGDIGCIILKDPAAHIPEDQYLYLDFEDGQVNGIFMVDREKAEQAKFIITGDYLRWKQVARKELDAVKAMMQGKLKLKGNLPYVVKYVKGVQESIRCLTELDAKFPDD
ncbi:MAG: SCP2 sterol-binding domain-containing protein [Deltaproteobacteria bacterium]|nr:SCP2 sterol-binding domain-containing protein [Deltaproteobacteria bacterium]